MGRYEFRKSPKNLSDTDVVVRLEGVTLDEVCDAFGDFLRGCGFFFDGAIGVVPSDALRADPLEEEEEEVAARISQEVEEGT